MTDPKPADLERALRKALRPVEPRAGFEERVMRALDASGPAATALGRREPLARRIARLAESVGRAMPQRPAWALGTAAAVLLALLAAGGLSYREHVRMRRAEETRGQVLEALRIANDKLDAAFRLLAEEPDSRSSPSRPDGEFGGNRQLNGLD